MLRPLILHIGLSKTGSSSIQHVLGSQRAALLAQGVYLPRSPGWANHALLPAACTTDLKILWGYHYGTWEGMAPAVRIARFREEFAAEMAALPDDAPRTIMTAEQMGQVLRHDDEVARLHDMLRPWFDPIRVVVYLRRQDQHATSAYTEILRGGTMVEPSLPAGGPERHPTYDYGALLDRWARVFGDAAMVPRIFDRARLRDGDVVADFLEIADISLPSLDPAKRQSNPSVTVAGQSLLLAAGRRLAATSGDTIWRDTPAWRRLVDVVTEAMPGRGWRPTRDEASEFLARFAATNEHARARFFPQQPTLFDPGMGDLPEHAEQPAPGQALQAALDALLREIRTNATREALGALAQYRLFKRLSDRPGMRTSLVRAVKLAPDLLPPRLRLAEFFLDEGDLRQAREHIQVARHLAPEDAMAKRLERRLEKKDE